MNELASDPAKRLSSILISPNQDLAQQVGAALQGLEGLSIGAHLAQYPSSRELTESVRRMQPDVILIDVSSDRDPALQLIAQVVDYWPNISAVGISRGNEPESILQCLRSGAHEFLGSPFSQDDVHQAVQRILRRRTVEAPAPAPKQGRLLTFASVKGGAGSTLIAANAACQIQRVTKGRVLLIDCNLITGLISFLFRINHSYSLTDALKHSSQLDPTLWGALVTSRNDIDILTSPEQPELTPIEPYAVQEMLEFSRSAYDHVVADLSGLWGGVSLAALPLANGVHLVCGSDMPSLYLMRRSIQVLHETGYSPDQLRVIVNRFEKRSELSVEDMQKIFRAPVHMTFPDDRAGVDKALRDGVPLAENSEFGKSMGRFIKGLLADQTKAAPEAPGVRAFNELVRGT